MMKALLAGIAATAILSGAAYAQQIEASASAQPAAASASQRVGMAVYGANGQQIGVIDEIVKAKDGSEVAVISVGTYLGLGAKRIAVPMSSLTPTADGKGVTIALTAEEIEAAPEYKSKA